MDANLGNGDKVDPKELSPPGTKPLRILVVEDNLVNQAVLLKQLEKAGHRPDRASNGREALEILNREPFDLVLMDEQMPEMDGLRATRLLRAREKAIGGRVPIIAVTANVTPGERERCLAAGMDAYLTKPVSSAMLFATIASVMGSKASEASAPAEEDGEKWLATMQSLGFDAKAIARLVRTALEEVPERMVVLRQGVALGDAVAVKTTAHSLKGTLGIFSAGGATAAARLEGLASRQQMPDFAVAFDALEAEVTPLLASLGAFASRGTEP
jgi:CheY-like chemotaxis protein/HPt (histidine-containing phosphotransfer) domain-containing protein